PRALRLSDWLIQQPPTPGAYPLGLSLRLPEEVPFQTGMKLDLVSALSGADDALRADAAAMRRLRDFIAGLPVTGRVVVANADGRWLQTNPSSNPLLTPGYSVVLPERPRTLTVITSEGRRCDVIHAPGREAKAYVEECRRAGAARTDWAWIAQPDGRVQRFGVALWNGEKQDEPAVGAWIWAPGRNSGWTDAFSDRFIRFLATQGPALETRDAGHGVSPGAPAPRSGAGSGTRGATAGGAEGMVLGGGMSLGMSPDFLAQHTPPEHPPLPPIRQDPLLLRSEERAPRSRNPEVSSSDWGSVGLLQTPTARMRDAGTLAAHYSHVSPYAHINIMAQPFDWLEAGFRYTEVSNRLYSQETAFSGTQSYKDKSIDVKFRAWKESAYIPEIAVGLRDVGGTGFFGGEYVVGNKRTGDFDWSLGLGWGYLGARGDMRNPLSVFSSEFDTRSGGSAQGGTFNFKRYFRGRAAVFGGVQYHTPWDPLTVKVEYEGNDYASEPLDNNLRQGSAFNFGLVYRPWPGIDLSLGIERGNTVMFGVTLHSNLSRMSQPKLSDPKPVPVVEARPVKSPDWSATARAFKSQTDWDVRSIEQRDNEVKVVVEDAAAAYWRYRVDRGAAVLHRDAPAGVDRFTMTYRSAGVDTAEHVIDRQAWVAERTQPVPPSARQESVIARAPEAGPAGDVVHAGVGSPVFEHGLRLSYGQTLGSGESFLLWQLGLVESARLKLRDDTWLQGSVRLRLVDNYDKFKHTGPSVLPRVRTFQREYLTTSTVTMPNFQLTHVGKAGNNHYYSAYAGYLEEMFAGAGGEWLYRPFASRLAFGIDLNAVRQREFEQHFALRDYSVLTGHGTMYWETGWNDVLATVSGGRYLAGDEGVTLRVARTFRNGVTIGAFATKTNVSAAEFGEGSFDKGIFVSVPFDVVFTRSSRSSFNTLWRPLTRDGGAMLNRNPQLYTMTGTRSDRTLWREPAPLSNELLKATDQKTEYRPATSTLEPYTRVTPKASSQRWEQPGSVDEHRVVSSLYAQ
ncbi:MAG TPA: YjbH domain-containing protein, partial [Burkholderiales bacterium]|nr:YjbH domain-containing protein [Burkholderiales bacterium]